MNVVKCTRGKVKSWKKTMGITLPEDLIERARNQGLNIGKVTENALLSIIDCLQVQTTKKVVDAPRQESMPSGLDQGVMKRKSQPIAIRNLNYSH